MPPLVVGTDNHPARNLDVYQWLAERLGGTLAVPDTEATGKRLRSGFIAAGGYRLRYPDYRAGYQTVLEAR